MPGFSRRRRHFEPEAISSAATAFVCSLNADTIDEEIQEYYQEVKKIFGLRKRQITHESGMGEGSIDTDFFRFTVETRQDRSDSSCYVVVRRLWIRGDPETHRLEIDRLFGEVFDRLAIRVNTDVLDYDRLVDLFEEVQENHGGKLLDEDHKGRITYTAPDDTRLRVDFEHSRITILSGRGRRYSELLEIARTYRFGLGGPSRLLLT